MSNLLIATGVGITLLVVIPILIYIYSKIQAIAWFHTLEFMMEVRTHKTLEEWVNGR